MEASRRLRLSAAVCALAARTLGGAAAGQGAVTRGDIQPTWSPDGKRIANTNPAWSVDGKQIAFASTRDNESAIYVMNADGSGQKRIS